MDPKSKKDFIADYDYEFDEKHKTVSITERGVAKAEKFLGIDHLYKAENGPLVNHLHPVAEGRVALQARRRLRGGRRRGEDHRRVHRPHPRRPPLVGGPAPGGRGQGGRARPRGEPDARDDHAPELLPHVRQARRHDGHRPHRGQRVHEDLQAAGGRDPDQPADGPQGPERPDLQDQGRQVGARSRTRSPSATRRASRSSSARSRSRSPSCCREQLRKRGIPHTVLNAKPEYAEREGEIDRRGRRARARSRSPPTWPAAASTSSSAATPSTSRELELAKLGLQPGDPDYDERFKRRPADDRGARRGRPREGRSRPAACSSSAPSATSRAGSTTSCAAAPAARATPASRASSSPPRTTSCACSPATGSTASSTASAPSARRARRSRSRPRCSRSRSRAPSARSRSRTSSSASACSSTTTS